MLVYYTNNYDMFKLHFDMLLSWQFLHHQLQRTAPYLYLYYCHEKKSITHQGARRKDR